MQNGRIYESLKQKIKIEKISLCQMANMRIGEIASSVEYRMDEQFENCQFLEPNFDFTNSKNSRNLLTFQFGKIEKFAT